MNGGDCVFDANRYSGSDTSRTFIRKAGGFYGSCASTLTGMLPRPVSWLWGDGRL